MREVLTLSLPNVPTRNSLEEKPLFEEHFQTIENEEKGDCAFIAIVQAMSINSKAPTATIVLQGAGKGS